ncbi:hypothetical protein PINS_up006304 [Pythium insidiosum]|nr:hypothetical protein PINS_up006304 [Pythium insidiosum]
MKFYSSASRLANLTLCADFDETISTRDTIALLFDASTSSIEDECSRQQHRDTVRSLVDVYVSESSQLMAQLREPPSSAIEAFDGAGLDAFLRRYSQVDLQSLERVVQSKALRGLTHADLDQLAGRVQLMTTCPQVLERVPRVRVVSANWSARMLQAALASIADPHPDMEILANDLEMDSNGQSTGDLLLRVQSPHHKADVVRQQRRTSDDVVIFIGDSTNDLLAMLEADVGVVVAPRVGSSFSRICETFGISSMPLSSRRLLHECRDESIAARCGGRRILFEVDGWDGILRALELH